MQKNLRLGLSRGATKSEVKTWPGLPGLMLLRVMGLIWSTSDLNHAVIGPARLLMASYLGLCRIRNLSDISSGLFICALWLQFEEYSKRFVPEAVTFLVNVLLHLSPHKIEDIASLPGSFPSPDFGMHSELRIDAKKARKLSLGTPDLPAILLGAEGEQVKVDLLGTCLTLLERFVDQYKSLDGCLELYLPVQAVLVQLRVDKLPRALQVCDYDRSGASFDNNQGSGRCDELCPFQAAQIFQTAEDSASPPGTQTHSDPVICAQV